MKHDNCIDTRTLYLDCYSFLQTSESVELKKDSQISYYSLEYLSDKKETRC